MSNIHAPTFKGLKAYKTIYFWDPINLVKKKYHNS